MQQQPLSMTVNAPKGTVAPTPYCKLNLIMELMMHQKLEPKVTLVTGSDFTHEKSLYNFLTSAKNHAPNIPVIIYDLGMTPKQLRKIRREFSYEIRSFDYSKYPDFFNIRIAQGRFAWKPVIIAEVAKQRGGIVCWMARTQGFQLNERRISARCGLYWRSYFVYSPQNLKIFAEYRKHIVPMSMLRLFKRATS